MPRSWDDTAGHGSSKMSRAFTEVVARDLVELRVAYEADTRRHPLCTARTHNPDGHLAAAAFICLAPRRGIFALDDSGFGIGASLEGVAAGEGTSAMRVAGRLLRIAPVGGDLSFGCHTSFLWVGA